MKNYLNRILSLIIIGSLVLGMFCDMGPRIAYAEQNISYTYLTFEDYQTAYEELPNSTMDWTQGYTEKVQTLDKVNFTGEVTFSAEGSKDDCTLIIGGGIGLYISGDRMYAYNHYVLGGQVTDIGAASANYPNRISLLFDKKAEGKWVVTYQVNGVTTEPVSYSHSEDFDAYLLIRPNDEEDGDSNSIACDSVQEGYTYLSFHDYRVVGQNALDSNDWTEIPDTISTGFWATTNQVNTLDKVIFQGKVTFHQELQEFVIGGNELTTTGIGGATSKVGHGIRFYISNGMLYVGNHYRPHDAVKMLGNATLGTPIDIRLQFEQVKLGTWKVLYEIDQVSGELEFTNLYPDGKGYSYDFGSCIRFVMNEGVIDVVSTVGNNQAKIMEPVSYDLAGGSYLVSGTATVKNAAGQIVLTTPCANPTLEAAGDYEITTMVGSFPRQQQTSLYRVGDVNQDGLYDSQDYERLEELLHYSNEDETETYVRPYKADCAEEYAADLNNNGKVDKQDLDLLDSVVNERTTSLELVLDKYHVPAVSYDYLGGKDVMPISGFYGPYYGPLGQKTYNFLTDDIYQQIKKTGVNLINFSINTLGNNSGTRYVYEQLEMAEKYGIGQFVSDLSLNPEQVADSDGIYQEVKDTEGTTLQDLAKQIGKFSYFGSYLGTNVVDEPFYYYSIEGTPTQTSISQNNKQLKYYDWISKKLNGFTNNLGFVNSVGSGSESVFATSYWNGVENFKQGLEKIVDATNAKILSYTSYPFSTGKTLDDVSVLSDCNHNHWGTDVDGVVCSYEHWSHYYENLWDSMTVAKENGTTFWAYTASGGDHRDGKGTQATDTEKLPTEAETYWDINHKLAFGAKGIEWFTVLQPWYFILDDTKEDGNDHDRSGLINLKGELTTFGKYATEINKHIAAMDDVLMRSKSKGIIATGDATITRVTSDGDTLLKNGTTKLASVSGDVTNGYGALVGCFDYGDTEAFYVVNYSLDTKQSFTLQFRQNSNYRYVSEAVDYTGKGSSLTLNDIEPGAAVLVVLDEADIRYTDEADKMLQVEATDMASNGKDITFYTDHGKSLYGSNQQEIVRFGYDTDAVFLNNEPIYPTITEVNDHNVWGFALDMSEIDLNEGDVIGIRGVLYPTSGNNKGRLTQVTTQYYMWLDGVWSELPSGYYDVETYKGQEAIASYPICDGKVFAGWFTDETCDTVYEGTEGVAYAKFVDAGILTNLAQIPIEVTYDTDNTKMRFISAVDSLEYHRVGFTIEVEGSTKGPKDVITDTVYKEIVTNEGGVEFTKKPTDIHKDAEYFFTYTLTDIGNALFGRKIYVTPFWITLDGTKVTGERLAKTVHMGIVVNEGTNNKYDDIINGGDDETGAGGFTEVEDPETGYGPIS